MDFFSLNGRVTCGLNTLILASEDASFSSIFLMEARSVENLSHALPAGDSAEPHYALFLVLGYLRLPELLAFRQVCKAFRDQIAADETLWRHITVEPPLSARLRDDILSWITSFSRGNLKSLALLRCWRVTDAGLLHVVERSPHITKVCFEYKYCGSLDKY